MANHLIKRGNTYYARLSIPEDARRKLGKREFIQSLKTRNKDDATLTMHRLVPQWKRMIAAARGEPGELEALAINLHFEDKGAENPVTGMHDVDYYVEEMAEDLPPSEAQMLRELYDGRRGVPFDYFGKQFVESVYTNDKTKGDAYRSLKLYGTRTLHRQPEHDYLLPER